MGSKAEKAVEIKARLKVKVNAGQPVQALRWPAPRTAAAAICPKISRMDKTTTLSRSNSERPRLKGYMKKSDTEKKSDTDAYNCIPHANLCV